MFLGRVYFNQSIASCTRNTFCGTWYLPHSRVDKSIAELCSNFGDSAITKGQIAYFSLRMRKTALFLLPVKNLTSPSYSPTSISYNTREFWRFGHKYGPNCIFLLRMRETPIILLPVKHLTSSSCSPTQISYMRQEFWRFGHKYGPNCTFFHCACAKRL